MEKRFDYPGVYSDEFFLLPKSVAQVETAVPAFVGYTEKAFANGNDLHSLHSVQPLEINSFAEYETFFGGAPEPASVVFELDSNNSVISVKTEELCFLYYSVKLFFENGGTTCLIISVGNYASAAVKVSKQQLLEGLACLEKTDAPTLLIIPDAVKLSYAEAGEVHAAMLNQSGKLNDRFALLDLVNGNIGYSAPENPVGNFRQNLGMNSLSYGAAYYPWLVTSWRRNVTGNTILKARYIQNGVEVKEISRLFDKKTINALQSEDKFLKGKARFTLPDLQSGEKTETNEVYVRELYCCLKDFYNFIPLEAENDANDPFAALHRKYIAKNSAFHSLVKKLHVLAARHHLSLAPTRFNNDFSSLTFSQPHTFIKARNRTRKHSSAPSLKSLILKAEQLIVKFFDEIEKLQIHFQEQLKQLDRNYDSVVRAMEEKKPVVPPGGSVAGIMARVDRDRGVWKAPANVSLQSVADTAVKILQYDQENLNVDLQAGKSVNALRFFSGKGVVVWGARTLAGNNNEWKYVNVRRFLIMVEQSIREAIRPFIFEPNNEATWGRVKAMVENFYYSLWQSGALQGARPDDAFFVKLGLGETMTVNDFEKGTMVLITGLAVVRPAEFIILSVSQTMLPG